MGDRRVCLAVTVILQAEVALLHRRRIVGILYYGSLFKKTPAALSLTAPVLAQLAPGTAASGSIVGKLFLFFLKAGRSPSAAARDRAVPRAGTGAAIRLAR